MSMCAEFDRKIGGNGIASSNYVADEDMTMFGFAIAKAGVRGDPMPLAMYARGTSADKKTPELLQLAKQGAIGAFVYNAQHVWYVKRVRDGWVRIDSLSGVTQTSIESAWMDGLGIELVFPPPDAQLAVMDVVHSIAPVIPPQPVIVRPRPQTVQRVHAIQRTSVRMASQPASSRRHLGFGRR